MKKAVFLSCIAFLYCLTGLPYLAFETFYDEGVMLTGAERILHGDILYKDFWTAYPPGSFWLLSLAFKFFGASLLVERILGITLWSLLIGSIYLLAAKVMNSKKAFAVSCIILIWMAKGTNYNYPVIPALFCIVCGTLFLDRSFQEKKRGPLFFVGMWGGMAILFRHDIGITFLFVLLLLLFFDKRSLLPRERLQRMLCLCGGGASILFPPLSYFFLQGATKDIVNNLVLLPMTIYLKMAPIPIQLIGLQTICLFCLTLFCLGWGIYFFSRFRQTRPWRSQEYLALLLLLFSGPLLLRAMLRLDLAHLFAPLSLSLLLAGYLLEQGAKKNKRNLLATGIISILIFFGLLPPLSSFASWLQSIYRPERYVYHLPRAQGFYHHPYFDSQEKAIRYIRSHVPSTEKIYVGLTHHQKLIGNDALFYFLAERMPATRYHELYPGIATREDTQREIARDLKKNQVRYVVLWNVPPPVSLPAHQKEGSPYLDEFIRTNYRVVASFHPYIILKKN